MALHSICMAQSACSRTSLLESKANGTHIRVCGLSLARVTRVTRTATQTYQHRRCPPFALLLLQHLSPCYRHHVALGFPVMKARKLYGVQYPTLYATEADCPNEVLRRCVGLLGHHMPSLPRPLGLPSRCTLLLITVHTCRCPHLLLPTPVAAHTCAISGGPQEVQLHPARPAGEPACPARLSVGPRAFSVRGLSHFCC